LRGWLFAGAFVVLAGRLSVDPEDSEAGAVMLAGLCYTRSLGNQAMSKPPIRAVLAVALISLVIPGVAQAQEHSSDAAQANNPLANFKALNFQDYYIGKLTDPDKAANQFWVRYA